MGKSAFLDKFAADKNRIEDGQWVDLGDGVKIKVRRENSKAAREVHRHIYKPYRNMMRGGRNLPIDLGDELARKWAAEGLLVDWEGVTDEKGKQIPYSPENAAQVFTAHPDFLEEVAYFATEAETYRKVEIEEDEKNSPGSASGSSGTANTSKSSKSD